MPATGETPNAASDQASTPADTAVTVDVLANDGSLTSTLTPSSVALSISEKWLDLDRPLHGQNHVYTRQGFQRHRYVRLHRCRYARAIFGSDQRRGHRGRRGGAAKVLGEASPFSPSAYASPASSYPTKTNHVGYGNLAATATLARRACRLGGSSGYRDCVLLYGLS